MIRKIFQILLGLSLMAPTANALVDMKNANFADTWIDLIVPGSGYDLRVQRTYNSRTLFNGVFGFGWCSDFETKLEVTPENIFRVTECGGGQEIVYTPKGFNKSTVDATIKEILSEVKKRNKSANAEFLTRLEKDLTDSPVLRREFTRELELSGKVAQGVQYLANGRENEYVIMKGSSYTRMLADGTYQKFDANGRLTHLYDRNGNYLKLVYQKDLLVSVTDNNGRKLSFAYDIKTKRIREIKGPNNLTVTYKIVNEDLVEVNNAWSNKFTYKYDDLHNLTHINYPDKTHKELTYNKDKDWVTSFKNRKGCKEVYDYEVDSKDPKNHYWSNVVKTCNGKVTNRSRYEFWNKEKRDGTGKYLARVRSEVNGNITDISYHEIFGKPLNVVRNASRTIYSYYDNGLVKTKEEDFRKMAFAYENSCRKPSDVVVELYELAKSEKAAQTKVAKAASAKKTLSKSIKTQYLYDKVKCNLVLARNSDGQTARVKYDRQGRIAVIEDQSKKLVSIKYEGRFGKPAIVSIKGLGTINVAYKPDGQIKDVKSKDGTRVAVQVASIFNNLLDLIAPATSEAAL